MGCAKSRSRLIEEEAIGLAEEALKFHLNEAQATVSVMRKHSTAGNVNQTQLTAIGRQLGLRITNSSSHTKIQSLLNKIQQFDQQYPLEDLLVIGILLSKGTAFTKAGLLFQAFCEPEKTLSLTALKQEVLPKLCQCSLGLSSIVSNAQSKRPIELRVSKFVDELGSAQAQCVKKVADHMGLNGTQVSLESFVRVLRTFRNGSLVTSNGWRLFMHEELLEFPLKNAWTSQFPLSQLSQS